MEWVNHHSYVANQQNIICMMDQYATRFC